MKQKEPARKDKSEKKAALPEGIITIDDFMKVKLCVAEILSAQPVPKADKLLQLQLSIGEEQRQVVSGIASFYKPEELKGRHVVLVKNLKPAKLRGVKSEGMILAAGDGEDLKLVEVSMPAGTEVR